MRFVDQLLARFGEKSNYVKRGDIKKAAKELLSTMTAPAWITRNTTPYGTLGSVRIAGDRGRYNLTILKTLPVVDDPEKTESTADSSTEAPPKRMAAAAAKKTAAKKAPAPPKKKASAPKKKKDPEPPVENDPLPVDPDDPDEDEDERDVEEGGEE